MRIIKIIILLCIIITGVSCTFKNDFTDKLVTDGVYKINEELTLESIYPGVILVNHKFPWGANSLIFEMESSEIVLIDTPYTYQATKYVVEWIRSIVGQSRKVIAINTGFHFDNLGGNKYLVEQGIEIYGTTRTVDLIEQKGEAAKNLFLEWLQSPINKKYYDEFAVSEYVKPTVTLQLDIDQEVTLNFGGDSLLLYYPGESHSPDNFVVYSVEKEILFGGCMVKELKSKDLGNIADANLSEWVTSIERLQSKFNKLNTKIVVPGHGDLGGIQLLARTLSLLKK